MKLQSILFFATCAAAAVAAPQAAHAADCGDTVVIYNLFDMSMDEMFGNDEGHLGPRRLVTEQYSTIPSYATKRFIQATPSDIDSLKVVVTKTDNGGIGGKTAFVVCSTDANDNVVKLEEFSISGGSSNIGTTVQRTYSNLRDKRLSVRLVGKSPFGSARFNIDIRRPGVEGQPWTPVQSSHSQPLSGFADLHVHQAADLAFAGGWYWGSHREGSEATRLAECGGDNHATIEIFGGNTGVDYIDPHTGETNGYPSFEDWPRWDDIKHQQVGLRWLQQAHENGLNVMVVSVVNNQWLSAATIASGHNDNRMSPSDMESVKRQILSITRLAEVTPWYTIVRDPWEARRAIEAGQLAVVLAVEVSDVLPPSDGPWIQQLHDLYDMGVRTVQLAHQTNSLFAGAAFHREILEFLGMIKAWFDPDIEYATTGDGNNNPIGLSADGEALLREMVRLGMLIDIAHLSLETQRTVFDMMSEDYGYYPLYVSHTRADATLLPEQADVYRELVTTDEVLEYVRQTGGQIGLRTAEDPMLDYGTPNTGAYVANNCDGSTRSFAQNYQYAADRGVNIALGSDFNGFITQTVPRFGPGACAGAPDEATRLQQAAAQGTPRSNAPAYLQEYWTKGMAHIGLLPAIIDDMDELGVDTSNVRNSAESFVQMWERVYDPARGRVN
ncbi:membrane dipeptidase [Haliangium ochraceum]|uniref:Peptidase M19 renal dipeptidase n=1 Tax=Haliangium ochraceum (strain DSM 14365 / JCM 11303 / SMP-2) TaxID=502025 RepID=D0LRP6_HALO1|nr:membrane dipeptidase [Haliangium ochraceum]ACY19038.1 peptidase M19 renal dipeptidase [Haliangium ochraceum DSM 14365]